MPKFAFIYRGGNAPKSQEEGAVYMTKWRAWRDGLGDAYVYPGMPFSSTFTVRADGVTDGSDGIPMTGVSVIEAENRQVAEAIARACPHLDLGGDIVVAEGMDMEM